jgi:hypothetical protein
VQTVSELRRYLHQHRLRVDWLALKTGIPPRRMYRLAANLARWTIAEANLVADALAAQTGEQRQEIYHRIFAGVPMRRSAA